MITVESYLSGSVVGWPVSLLGLWWSSVAGARAHIRAKLLIAREQKCCGRVRSPLSCPGAHHSVTSRPLIRPHFSMSHKHYHCGDQTFNKQASVGHLQLKLQYSPWTLAGVSSFTLYLFSRTFTLISSLWDTNWNNSLLKLLLGQKKQRRFDSTV